MPRQRSARAAASRPAAARGVYVQTPRSDVFVVMLGIALGAILLGCLLLVLLLNRYEFQTSVSHRDAPAAAPLARAGGTEILSTVRL